MRHPRTLLATIGVTAVAFALTLGSVIFNAAISSETPEVATAAMTTEQTVYSSFR